MTINGIPKPAYRAMELLNLPSVANGTVRTTLDALGKRQPTKFKDVAIFVNF